MAYGMECGNAVAKNDWFNIIFSGHAACRSFPEEKFVFQSLSFKVFERKTGDGSGGDTEPSPVSRTVPCLLFFSLIQLSGKKGVSP